MLFSQSKKSIDILFTEFLALGLFWKRSEDADSAWTLK